MAQCLYIRIWRNTDSHRIRYQTWRCLWNLIRFWFTHSFTIKLKHGANIREISEIAKGFLVFNTSGSPTDFTDEHRFLCGLGGLEFERVTQISQMTQIFWPIRSDLRRLFANLCGSPCRGQKSKGLAESAYAIKLRLSVAWRKTLFWLFLQIFLYPRL